MTVFVHDCVALHYYHRTSGHQFWSCWLFSSFHFNNHTHSIGHRLHLPEMFCSDEIRKSRRYVVCTVDGCTATKCYNILTLCGMVYMHVCMSSYILSK